MTSVRNAVATDVPALVETLARAFDDDPVSCYIFPDPERRPRGLRRFFRLQLRHAYLPRGEVYTTEERRGAALWLTPDSPRPGLRDLVNQLPMVPLLGRRLVPTLELIGILERRHPRGRHYYLATLGTDPDWQGRGIGSALLQPVLSRCDEEGIPAYLESSKERNVPFYRRHGFEVRGEVRVPEGPTLWLMWREPDVGRLAG